MNNFPSHGGTPKAIEAMRTSPGFIDLWQLHSAPLAGERNAPDEFIANLGVPCDGDSIAVSATADGAFTVRNSRNGFEKKYPALGK